jgi:hypothetical protein
MPLITNKAKHVVVTITLSLWHGGWWLTTRIRKF